LNMALAPWNARRMHGRQCCAVGDSNGIEQNKNARQEQNTSLSRARRNCCLSV
jgi:hypothetical protein